MLDDDERGDFPPTKHPGREAITMIAAALALAWLIWRAFEWLLY